MRKTLLMLFVVFAFLATGTSDPVEGSGLTVSQIEQTRRPIEITRGGSRTGEPDTILFDDGVPYAVFVDPGLWSGVRFTPVLDFELRSIYFAVHNPFNQSPGCTLYVVADSSGFPTSTVISGPHYVPGPLPNLTWIQVDLPESVSFLPEQDFHIIYGPQPGGMNYPSDSTEGWWDIMDSSTTTYRSNISFDRARGWMTDSIGDFFIRAGGEITSDTTRYVPGYLLVRFKEGTPQEVVDSINGLLGTQTLYYDSLFDYHFLEITSRDETKRVISNYLQLAEVRLAAADLKVELCQFSERTPDDPGFNNQWNLHNLGQLGAGLIDADIDAPQMWRMHTDCDTIVIGILDTGADLGHPDLVNPGPPARSNLWTNGGEIPGNLNDDEGNGYPDDIHGLDFDVWANLALPAQPTDAHGHGTAVAGIVGAIGNNNIDIAGICWHAKMMILKAQSIQGIRHAVNYMIHMKNNFGVDLRIVNQSSGMWVGQGGPTEKLIADLFRLSAAQLAAANILWITCAGNTITDLDGEGLRRMKRFLYPAMLPDDNVICVAASDSVDDLAFWGGKTPGTSYGKKSVDLAAPGKRILTLKRVAAGGGTRWFSGTSAAAPHVTGVAALVWSLDPARTLADVRNILLNGAPHPSLPSAVVEQKPAFVGITVTGGRLRAPVNGDFGDASDRPYPTRWPQYFGAGSDGPRHLDCGLEWLGDSISVERDPTDPLDTDGVINLIDTDGGDDGVHFFPPYFCKGAARRDRVKVRVTARVPTPPAGAAARYGGAVPGGRYLYLNAWFDFNGDGDWVDVFTCPPGAAGNAREHILWQGVAGAAPGIKNAAGFHNFPDSVIVIDPSAWGAAPGALAFRDYTLEFYSPPKASVVSRIWTRFRLEYDDTVVPADFKGTFNDYSRFGEVEDYYVKNLSKARIPNTDKCVNPGEYVSLPILLENNTTPFGGFELEVEFDYTSMTFVSADPGPMMECFELFTYRLLPCPQCGCCKYKILLYGQYDIPNGPENVGCPIPVCQGEDSLAYLNFVVNNDENLRGLKISVCWEWEGTVVNDTLVEDWECEENTFSSWSGDTLYTSALLCQFNPDICDDPADRIQPVLIFQDGVCGQNCGGVDVCPAGPGECKRGDVNYNTLTYEVADAVLFASYFVEGLSEFRYDQAYQICATDVNADGRTLTLSDLVYLIRVILHDAAEIPKLTPSDEVVSVVSSMSESGVTVTTASRVPIGAALFVFDHKATADKPELLVEDVEMLSHDGDGQFRVLIWSRTGKSIPSGEVDLFTFGAKGEVELITAQLVDHESRELRATISTKGVGIKPRDFALFPNYPNPFNIETQIRFDLPTDCRVSLRIYNVKGQLVNALTDEYLEAGRHTVGWDGTNESGNAVASGVYFYKLTAGGFSATEKMVMMK